ncbi:MAG: hypothetical protein K0Q55_3360 [Verrucomicrobia bacterium]|nr:hypothetical protein [Verrucomicrobiota bacterium]
MAALGQYWNCWVQQWLEAPTVPGAKTAQEVLMAISQDHPAKGTLTFRNHGPASASNTNVTKMAAEEVVAGPEFVASANKSFEAAAVQQGRANDIVAVTASRRTNFEAVIDLRMLRPYVTSRKVRTKFELLDEKPTEGVQESEFRFRWPEAVRR